MAIVGTQFADVFGRINKGEASPYDYQILTTVFEELETRLQAREKASTITKAFSKNIEFTPSNRSTWVPTGYAIPTTGSLLIQSLHSIGTTGSAVVPVSGLRNSVARAAAAAAAPRDSYLLIPGGLLIARTADNHLLVANNADLEDPTPLLIYHIVP